MLAYLTGKGHSRITAETLYTPSLLPHEVRTVR
jgi:hypothetical protein